MARQTDPAKEIADFCDALKKGASERGDIVLAKAFDVRAWSAEFFQILNAFMEPMEGSPWSRGQRGPQ